MNWLRKRRARKRRDEFVLWVFENKVLWDPRVLIGKDPSKLYMFEDEDVFCMWCGRNVTDNHAPWCDWLKMVKEWGQIQHELER